MVDDQEQNLAELKLEKAIDERLDEVVLLAENRVEKAKQQSVGSGSLRVIDKIQPAQLRNAATVASQTTTSYLTVKNWIRYQVGRSNSPWPRELAEGVIDDTQQLNTIATEISNSLAGSQVAAVHIRLVRLYIGYLIRAFTYAKKR